MAKIRTGSLGGVYIQPKAKKTRQGQGSHSKFTPTSRNQSPKKRSRGQGRG